MVTGWQLPPPDWPPVPTVPYDLVGWSQLKLGLQACRKGRIHPYLARQAKPGLARLWLHLALERGLDPRRTLSPTSPAHQGIAKAYLDAGLRMDLGDRTSMSWDLPEICELAISLWCAAKAAQADGEQPGLGLDLEPLANPLMERP